MDRETRYLSERIDGLRNRLDRFITLADLLKPLVEGLMSHFDDLKAEVKANRDVTRSAVALLVGLTDRLNQVQTPEDLTEVIDEIKADTAELAAAVAANTPALPTPVEPPTDDV